MPPTPTLLLSWIKTRKPLESMKVTSSTSSTTMRLPGSKSFPPNAWVSAGVALASTSPEILQPSAVGVTSKVFIESATGPSLHAPYSSLSKERNNVYVSLTGRVEMTRDSNRIDELWNQFAEAYFDGGRECADILVVTVDHSSGTYWTGPSGRIGSLISFVRAALGDASNAGDHGEVAL